LETKKQSKSAAASAAKKTPAERAAKALGHRIRVEALIILIEKVASPSQIAEELGHSLQNVIYHMKVLRENEAVELVERREARGGVPENFYRAAKRPELTHEEWLQLSEAHKQELALISVRNLFAESLSSVEHGSMVTDEEMYWWWKAALFDAQGREEVRKEQDAHVARLLAIEARSNARAVESRGSLDQEPTVLGVLGFNRARPGPVNEILPGS